MSPSTWSQFRLMIHFAAMSRNWSSTNINCASNRSLQQQTEHSAGYQLVVFARCCQWHAGWHRYTDVIVFVKCKHSLHTALITFCDGCESVRLSGDHLKKWDLLASSRQSPLVCRSMIFLQPWFSDITDGLMIFQWCLFPVWTLCLSSSITPAFHTPWGIRPTSPDVCY